MLQNWLSAIPLKEILEGVILEKHHFGKRISIYYGEELPDLRNVKIAIIGIGTTSANAVRKALYPHSCPFPKFRIVDLGNVRKEEHSFIIPVLKELMESDILPVIIGHSVSFTLSQFQAYQPFQKLINLILADEKIRYASPTEGTLIRELIKSRQVFNLGLLGYQTHFVDPKVVQLLESRNYEPVRLGRIRQHIEEIEPIIRDGDLMSFNISVIRNSDCPAQKNPTPNGLFSEEACQLCRYAGMSDKLTSMGFYGYDGSIDTSGISAQLIAQLIWYFIDGFFSRKQEYPSSLEGLTEYIVDTKYQDEQIVFWKSKRSGRWWMQVPVRSKKKYKRHSLVPCSYNDYLLACEDEFSDRLLNAYRRFG